MTARPHRLRLRVRPRIVLALLAPAIGTVAAATAHAGLVNPGEALTIRSDAFQHPGGTVLATQSIPFSLAYEGTGGAFVDFPGTVNAYFENAVVRDDATGRLSFVYGVVYEDGVATVGTGAGAELWAGGFRSYLTDVAGVVAFDAAARVSRSDDGSIVGVIGGGDGGIGGAPLLSVATDATTFDAAGSITFRAADSLLIADADGQTHDERVTAQITLDGAFRPTGAAPAAVPLPPAAFTGLGVMAACGILRLGRRFWDGAEPA